jgi:hypothetical protein
MTVNVAKTKGVVVSKPSARSLAPVAPVFTCDGLLVQHVDTFRYLGLQLHSLGSVSHLIAPLKANAS